MVKSNFIIETFYLHDKNPRDIIVDDKYYLEIEWCIAELLPLNKEITCPDFNLINFYSNCLAYIHDVPTIVIPRKRKALIKPLIFKNNKIINEGYYNDLNNIFTSLNSIKYSPLSAVYTFWSFNKNIKCFDLSSTYSKVSQELSLYNLMTH